MGWMHYVSVALVNTLGVVVGIIFVPTPPILAQSTLDTPEPDYSIDDSGVQLESLEASPTPENSVSLTEIQPRSLTELYQLRDRIRTELETVSRPPDPNKPQAAWEYQLQLQQYETLVQKLRQIETRIPREEQAQKIWQQALQLASQAVELGKSPSQRSVAEWEQAQQLWLDAISTLRLIPADSFLSEQSIDKIVQYQGNLAIVTYEKAVAQQAAFSQAQTEAETPEIPMESSEFPGFKIYGDTNRDGVVNEADEAKPRKWSLKAGPLMLFNNDDDDRNSLPDWKDQVVNGKFDGDDLALIHFKVSSEYAGSQLVITTDAKSQGYINLFQKTKTGWKSVDLSGQKPLEFSENIVLGIEAKQFANENWKGLVTLKAIARKNNQEIASDTLQIGVAPWILSPNTASVSELYMSERGENQGLVNEVKGIVEKVGAKTKITPGATLWMQGTQEIGYVQFPGEKQLEQHPVVLKGTRSGESDIYAKSLLNRDFGWFEMGESQDLDVSQEWSDWYSNLGVTPPLPDYPMGRIYYGKAENSTLDSQVAEFLKAQKIQGPPVEIDTSWLMVPHVDEIINFIPSVSGETLMLVASPGEGVKLLEELQDNGLEGAAINRGLSTQTTVRAALNNEMLVQYNLRLHRQKIEPLIEKLKAEFKLRDEQIIQIPVLFGYSGYAWWPNLVNSVYINGELLVSDPRGALIDGRDYTQEAFKKRIIQSGVNVNFLEDTYYQELKGNIKSATNTTRKGLDQPFWEKLPANLENQD